MAIARTGASRYASGVIQGSSRGRHPPAAGSGAPEAAAEVEAVDAGPLRARDNRIHHGARALGVQRVAGAARASLQSEQLRPRRRHRPTGASASLGVLRDDVPVRRAGYRCGVPPGGHGFVAGAQTGDLGVPPRLHRPRDGEVRDQPVHQPGQPAAGAAVLLLRPGVEDIAEDAGDVWAIPRQRLPGYARSFEGVGLPRDRPCVAQGLLGAARRLEVQVRRVNEVSADGRRVGRVTARGPEGPHRQLHRGAEQLRRRNRVPLLLLHEPLRSDNVANRAQGGGAICCA
mmetsp:Transcript_86393/g.241789  ORF Transcript_86393/g.241789 Transcript_86393/m.241789 type:complete len:287 (-) Transcript_86393:879-1739(-)